MFVNYSVQDNSLSYSWQDPIGPTCDTEFTFVRILCSLAFVQLIWFQLSQFDFCPEYVEKKPDNEIYIIVIQLYSVKYN